MKVRNLIVVIIAIFSVNSLFAQVSANMGPEKNIYTIEKTQANTFESKIKTYFGNDNQMLYVENQTKEAITIQIVTMDGKLSFLKATQDDLVNISLKELSEKGIFILQVFDVYGNSFSKRLLVY